MENHNGSNLNWDFSVCTTINLQHCLIMLALMPEQVVFRMYGIYYKGTGTTCSFVLSGSLCLDIQL